MIINYERNEIVMSKKESRESSVVGSKAFKDLKDLLGTFPGYKIVVKAAPKSKDHLKGLNVPYMKKYIEEKIKACENNPEELKKQKDIQKEFNTLRGLDENGEPQDLAPVATYGELKLWFLKKYPEIKNLSARVEKIIAAAKAA